MDSTHQKTRIISNNVWHLFLGHVDFNRFSKLDPTCRNSLVPSIFLKKHKTELPTYPKWHLDDLDLVCWIPPEVWNKLPGIDAKLQKKHEIKICAINIYHRISGISQRFSQSIWFNRSNVNDSSSKKCQYLLRFFTIAKDQYLHVNLLDSKLIETFPFLKRKPSPWMSSQRL